MNDYYIIRKNIFSADYFWSSDDSKQNMQKRCMSKANDFIYGMIDREIDDHTNIWLAGENFESNYE